MQAGTDSYLPKLVGKDALLQSIEELLNNAGNKKLKETS
jgi:hypothetical protein